MRHDELVSPLRWRWILPALLICAIIGYGLVVVDQRRGAAVDARDPIYLAQIRQELASTGSATIIVSLDETVSYTYRPSEGGYVYVQNRFQAAGNGAWPMYEIAQRTKRVIKRGDRDHAEFMLRALLGLKETDPLPER